LQSSWTHLVTPSRNFVEVRWRSLFRSTSIDKRCTYYNTPPTSWKRAANRWSLRNFLPRSSLFLVGKAQKSHGGEMWTVWRMFYWGSTDLGERIHCHFSIAQRWRSTKVAPPS
jgi:hypothetical protein